jgi:hypothetical protein
MRHIIPQEHANQNLPKHGYQQSPNLSLGVPTMKVKT